MITTEVKAIQFADADLAGEKWRPYPLFSGQTRMHDDMACHYSLLSPGHSPHPPHTHVEEEILIVLKGEADILIADGPQPDGARVERLRPARSSTIRPTSTIRSGMVRSRRSLF